LFNQEKVNQPGVKTNLPISLDEINLPSTMQPPKEKETLEFVDFKI
jgi:hypothetical protein